MHVALKSFTYDGKALAKGDVVDLTTFPAHRVKVLERLKYVVARKRGRPPQDKE